MKHPETGRCRTKPKIRNKRYHPPKTQVIRSKDARLHCGSNPLKGKSAMQNNPNNGQRTDPLATSRRSVIDAAADQFCASCGGQPCYLLTSAALAVFYETLTYNEDHISADRYEQALAGIHDCLMRHYEFVEYLRTDNRHPKKPEGSTNTFKSNGVNRDWRPPILQTEAGDPPSPN